MSVIQDALKRKLLEQEQRKQAGPAPPAGPKVPPQTPPVAQQLYRQDDSPPESRPAPAAGGGKWILGTALVALFAILVAGVLFYMNARVPLTRVDPPPGPAAVPPPPPARTAAPASPAPAEDTTETEPPAIAFLSPPPAASRPAGTAPAEAPPPQDWPEVTVDGVVAGSVPKNRSAILDGEMIFLNQKIKDMRLVEVTSVGVRLRFRGQEQFFEIGQVTNDRFD